MKRGITGVYHHVSAQHLKRYLAEFDFRYNARTGVGIDDQTRTERALRGIVGKRLMYRTRLRCRPKPETTTVTNAHASSTKTTRSECRRRVSV